MDLITQKEVVLVLKTREEQLEILARLAEANKKAVDRVLGKKTKKKINPFVQYAAPTKR